MVLGSNGLGGAGAFRGNRSVRLAVAGCGGPPTVGLGITWTGIIRLRVGAPVCAMGRAYVGWPEASKSPREARNMGGGEGAQGRIYVDWPEASKSPPEALLTQDGGAFGEQDRAAGIFFGGGIVFGGGIADAIVVAIDAPAVRSVIIGSLGCNRLPRILFDGDGLRLTKTAVPASVGGVSGIPLGVLGARGARITLPEASEAAAAADVDSVLTS